MSRSAETGADRALDPPRCGPYVPPVSIFAALRALHLLAMALWFSTALFFPGDVRRTLARGAPHTSVLAERTDRVVRFSALAGFLTVGTGLGLVFQMGGMRALPTRLHIGLGLGVLLLLLEVAAIGPVWAGVSKALAADKLDEARAQAKRLAPLSGVSHLLRLAAFVSMLVRV